jgi:hypothetical protein
MPTDKLLDISRWLRMNGPFNAGVAGGRLTQQRFCTSAKKARSSGLFSRMDQFKIRGNCYCQGINCLRRYQFQTD